MPSSSLKCVARPQQGIDGTEGLADDLRHAHEAAADALFGELEDLRFGIVEDLFRGIALFGSARDGGGSGVDQGAQQRFVAHDLDVILDAGAVGDAIEQAGDVSSATDSFKFAVAGEFLGQSDQVDGV
jgi:hypothetical protein